MRRRIVSAATPAAFVAAAAIVLTGLTGCSAPAEGGEADANLVSFNGCTNLIQPGALSDGVNLDSDGVDVVGPTGILNAQRTVLEHGHASGYVAQAGDVVTANVSTYDAVTGQLLNERLNAPHLALPEEAIDQTVEVLQSADSAQLTFDYLLATALVCAVPGDTIVLAMTPVQSMSSQMSMNAVVSVIEVLSTESARANGDAHSLPNGFPAVTNDENGRPGIVLPPQAAPSELRTALRIEGNGAEVTAEESVIGNVLTVGWDGNLVANTWAEGMPGFGTEESPNPAYTFRDALTGYPVGSQVVILDPNDGDPVVHVVDIVTAV